MPFIEYDPNSYPEDQPVPAGRYDVTIVASDNTMSKKEKPMFKIRLEINDHDEAAPVFMYLSQPYPGCDRIIGQQFNRFCDLFKLNVSGGFDPDLLAAEMPGHSANCELNQEEYEGNISNKLVLPKVSAYTTVSAGRGSPPGRKTA